MTRLPDGFLDRPFAHRALHGPGRPENSSEAISAAIEAGYGIEIDVQMTADAVAFVFHDYALDRLTGAEGYIQHKSAADIAARPLLGGDTAPPELDEVLALVAGKVPLVIEIKDQDGAMGTHVGALETKVASALNGYVGPVAVMSFNPNSMLAMKDAAPHIPRGLVTDPFEAGDWATVPASRRASLAALTDLDRVDPAFISHKAADLGSPHVARIKALPLPVLCWTIKSPAQEAEARKIADQITFEGYLA